MLTLCEWASRESTFEIMRWSQENLPTYRGKNRVNLKVKRSHHSRKPHGSMSLPLLGGKAREPPPLLRGRAREPPHAYNQAHLNREARPRINAQTLTQSSCRIYSATRGVSAPCCKTLLFSIVAQLSLSSSPFLKAQICLVEHISYPSNPSSYTVLHSKFK
jgi:hypothetical protein